MGLKFSFSKFGDTFPEAYARVRRSYGEIDMYNVGSQIVEIDIWVNQATRDAHDEVLASYRYYIRTTHFNTYFSVAVLSELGKNPYSQAYLFLLAYDPSETPTGQTVPPDLRGAEYVPETSSSSSSGSSSSGESSSSSSL